MGGGEKLEAADHDGSLLRRQGGHSLGDEIRGQHLADPGNDVTPGLGQPDQNPPFISLVADPRDEPLRLQALQQFRDGVAAQPQVLGLLAHGQRPARGEMLQHLERPACDRQIRPRNPVCPVVAPVQLRKEPRNASGGLLDL